jgi:hypothetical protein
MSEWAEKLMLEARAQVRARSKSNAHQMMTKGWYAGRKLLKKGPRKALAGVGKAIPVPVVGGLVSAAIDGACEKVVNDRKKKKQVKYALDASPQDVQSLRKAAKADVKAMKDVVEKINTNLPKLKDATTALDAACRTYDTAQDPNFDQLWTVALALCERERYENKILAFVETVKKWLEESVRVYVSASSDETDKLEKTFMEELDSFQDPSAKLLFGRSSSFSEVRS